MYKWHCNRAINKVANWQPFFISFSIQPYYCFFTVFQSVHPFEALEPLAITRVSRRQQLSCLLNTWRFENALVNILRGGRQIFLIYVNF